MGKLNDEEIELRFRSNGENNDLLRKENAENLILDDNSMNDNTNCIKNEFKQPNGDLRTDPVSVSNENGPNEFKDENNLLTDNLHIKPPFNDIDLNDKPNELNNSHENNENDTENLNPDLSSLSQPSSPSLNIMSNDKLDAYLNQNEILTNSIKLFRSEFRRLGFNEKYWRYSSFNKNFTLCSTYPPYFIIPAQFVDEDLSEVAKFRHIGRLPSVVYRHRNGAVIVRSSQPSVGLLSRRSTEDEKLLQLIFANCMQDQADLIENKSCSSSFIEDNKLTNCDCCNNTNQNSSSTSKLNGHSIQSSFNGLETTTLETTQPEYCKCLKQDVVINSKNCQPTQSSKFFSLSDKILENIMSYTSYNEVQTNQTTTTTNSLTNKKLLILDARSFTVAFLNRAFGGGSECNEYYPCCEVDYLYLANIHAVRTAFFSLKTLIRSTTDNQYNPPNSNYFTNWSKSNSNYWLYYISNLIESALKVVQAIDRDARPVLIHCSDGWDRTAQIASLAELMLDPYYRTIQGFKVLVQREWLDFGHKFADRCGLQPVSKNVNERSPIFIQWLDCVYQIVRQCPDYFEFNCTYLEELAFHTYSPLFGTFLCNSYLERFINQIHGETTSVWSYLEKSKDKFINENYIESIKVLEPSYSVSDMTLWRDLYQKLITDEFESRFDMKNSAQLNSNFIIKNQFMDVNNQRKKKLYRTNSFTSNLGQSSTKSNSLLKNNLKKSKSESELSSILKKVTFKDESIPTTNKFQPNNDIEQFKNLNLNFQFRDKRLDPQHNTSLNNGFERTMSNCSLNGSTCKFESKTNRSFLNCDSNSQYQVPLKVVARIAQVANSNPDSSLLTSVLTYMNTLHTFSVK